LLRIWILRGFTPPVGRGKPVVYTSYATSLLKEIPLIKTMTKGPENNIMVNSKNLHFHSTISGLESVFTERQMALRPPNPLEEGDCVL